MAIAFKTIVKTTMKQMPKCCDDCECYITRTHPHKGWTNICGITSQCVDDDALVEWIYDGNGRPKACPLIEVE